MRSIPHQEALLRRARERLVLERFECSVVMQLAEPSKSRCRIYADALGHYLALIPNKRHEVVVRSIHMPLFGDRGQADGPRNAVGPYDWTSTSGLVSQRMRAVFAVSKLLPDVRRYLPWLFSRLNVPLQMTFLVLPPRVAPAWVVSSDLCHSFVPILFSGKPQGEA